MPWPIDDLDLTDLAANSGNLARARSQIHAWVGKTKAAVQANPLINDDSSFYLLVSHDGTNNGVTIDDASPNASAFSVNADTIGSEVSEFSIRHDLGIPAFQLGYFFQILEQSNTSRGPYVTTSATSETRAADVMDAIILDPWDSSVLVPYSGTCKIGITMLVMQ